MNRSARNPFGFSLLEVIIATAILAASAMVLTSLLGLGSKYGNRAEERSLLVAQAQSLLDEFVVSVGAEGNTQGADQDQWELTGTLPGTPEHSYRLVATPFAMDNRSVSAAPFAQSAEAADATSAVGLTLLRIELFAATEPEAGELPMLELSQLVRTRLMSQRASTAQPAVRDPFQLSD